MKKSFVLLCFILAFPIIFSGSSKLPSSLGTRVYACVDQGLPGDEYCAERLHKRPDLAKTNNDPVSTGSPIGGTGSGLAALASAFLIWLGMRL